MEAGSRNIPALLKTRNLLIFRDAQNAENGKNCPQLETYLEREIFQFAGELHITYVADQSRRIC